MSGIATGTALAIAGGIGAAGSITSGIMGSNAAQNAASTQANAADYAANLQAQLGQESLANEIMQYEQGQANLEPWMQTGANSLASLGYLMGIGNPNGTVGSTGTTPGQTLSIPGVNGSVTIPGVTGLQGTANTNLGAFGSLMSAYPGGQFTAPTAAQAAASPGEQFALQQGEAAVQAGASANGSLLTGGTLNAENQYAQNLASEQYNNVYNQALQTYNTNYNTWANQQANEYNRLASLAGMGQTTAQQLTSAGLQSAGQVGSTLSNTGSQIASDYNNAAAATASGYIGSANALGGALTGSTNSLSNILLMQELMGGMSGSNPYQTLVNAQAYPSTENMPQVLS